jgi:hypothetical protein
MSSSVTLDSLGRDQGNDETISPFIDDEDIGNRMWGDSRKNHTEEHFRIVFWNCGGFPISNTEGKNRMIREWINEQEVDVMGFSECNIHWPSLPCGQRLQERTFGWFPTIHISVGYLEPWTPSTPTQIGGTSLWSINRGAHRVIKSGQDRHKLGRWCWTTYRGKNGAILRIISGYRCVFNPKGVNSAWSHQHTALLARDIDTDPREQFTDDLVIELDMWLREGEQIILGLDLNEPVLNSAFSTRLQALGLVEIMTYRHGTTPYTYARGSSTIDAIFVSPMLAGSQCGFYPILGDHRPSWIDVSYDTIFGTTLHIPPRARRLHLQDPRVVHRYTSFLDKYERQHHLLERAQRLSDRTEYWNEWDTVEYNEIDNLRSDGMLLAERQCRKLRMGEIPFSPEYSKLAQTVLFWRLVLKKQSGGSVDSRYFRRLLRRQGVTFPWIQTLTISNVKAQLQVAYRRLNSFSKTALEKREAYLVEVAAARATLSGLSPEQELQNMMSRETQRRDARLIRSVTNPSFRQGLSLIHVPQRGGIIEVDNKETMENILCDQLSLRFQQAHSTPFATLPLLQLIGPFGTGPGAQQILDGTFHCPDELDQWTKKLLPHLRYTTSAALVHTKFPMIFDPITHRDGWLKMKEHTSPGFSSLSFAQFKAAASDNTLCELDTIMASLPYQHGFSPSRWQHGIDVMLQKEKGNFLVDKLRAILLYEADFNQNNKRFGRDLMILAEEHGDLAIEQFGSRRGMSAVDQSLNKALTFDIWRQLRATGALCSNDAKSCYDRILHNFASICLQRLGAPIAPILSMFTSIQHLSHHIRTIHGVSEQSFSGTHWEQPIHGVGQGNGAGPQIWAAISTPLFNMLRSEGCGLHLLSSISKEPLHFVGYAYVDDTDLVSLKSLTQSESTTFNDIQFSVDAWSGALNTSGGALVPSKCHWYLVSFQWRNGLPVYKTPNQMRFRLTVKDTHGTIQEIKLLNSNQAEKTLGVYLAPDGNMKLQAEAMRKKAVEWSDRLCSASLPRRLTTQALLTTILKTLEYPLAVTTLTSSQCHNIMQPLLQSALPRMGIMRSFPRVLAYASHTYNGLAIPNLFWLQGFYHIERLLRYYRSQHLTGRLLGCNGSIFALPFTTYGQLATASWVSQTWEFLSTYSIRLDLSIPELALSRVHDQLLIPLFVSLGFSGSELHHINICRMFLKVATLSDITTGCGKFITYSARHGKIDESIPARYIWPNQGVPSSDHWTTWDKALKALCSRTGELLQPLGAWLPTHGRSYFFDASSDRVYHVQGSHVWYLRAMNFGRASRRGISRYGDPIACDTLPPSCLPATIDRHGSYTHLTGTSHISHNITEHSSGFFEYITDQLPVSASWVFRNIRFIGNFSRFSQQIRDSAVTFWAVSDGSFKNTHGTASWRLSLKDSEDYLMGSIITPGPAFSQSAYRSELSGIYGIAISLWALQRVYRCRISCQIGCDGLSALNQFRYLSDMINPNTPHFDLISATRWILLETKGTYGWRHILGHQDTRGIGALDIWATWNIQMDEAAKDMWLQTHLLPQESRIMEIYGEVGVLSIRGVKVVHKMKKTLLDYLGSIEAIPKWETKYNWTRGLGQTVHWKFFSTASKASSAARRLWVTKTTSGFFASGKMMKARRERTDASCPRCQFPVEDRLHIFQCPHPDAQNLWNSAMDKFADHLISIDTDVSVANLICWHMNRWQNPSYTSPQPSDYPVNFREAFNAQDELGWEAFLFGFLSIQWEAVQQAYLVSLNSKVPIKRWATSIILKLREIAWDMWDQRNQYLHDKDYGLMVATLNDELSRLYQAGATSVPIVDQVLFQVSLVDLLSSPVTNRQLWVRRVQTAVSRQQRSRSPFHNERSILRSWLLR